MRLTSSTLGRLRQKRGFDTQTQLSVAAGLNRFTYINIENGAQMAGPDAITKLSVALGLTVAEVLSAHFSDRIRRLQLQLRQVREMQTDLDLVSAENLSAGLGERIVFVHGDEPQNTPQENTVDVDNETC